MADDSGAVLLQPRTDLDEVAERAAKAAVAEMTKALALPPGATTRDMALEARVVAEQQNTNVIVPPYTALPRVQPSTIFPVGVPLSPQAVDPTLPGGRRPAPRVSDFPTSTNINLTDRLVPFTTLVAAATQVDVLRRCIEVRKAHLLSLKWDFIVTQSAIERIMAEQNISSPGKAAQIARAMYQNELTAAVEFWKSPDRGQGYAFDEWLAMVIEQQLVIDAITIWPHPTIGGATHSFEVLDGATIKPLLDYRGAVPQSPSPAYQQILKGFPRGEFIRSPAEKVDAEFLANGPTVGDSLVYRPFLRRPGVTPYGFSNVEQALAVADLYLKRQAWVRAEFTDGVLPTTNIETDLDPQTDIQRLREYEALYNDQLAGQIQERHRARLYPKGFKPQRADEWVEKYKVDYDEYLIKLFCMAMGVMPTEVGFSPKGGLGGKGYTEGEESATYRKATRPDVVKYNALISHLSWTFLGTPTDIEFTFLGYEAEDQLQLAQISDTLVRGAQWTVNQARGARGEPLLDIPEADTPAMMTPTGLVFLDGALERQNAAGDVAPAGQTPPADGADGGEPTPAAGGTPAELDKFIRYTENRRGRTWRDFEFDTLPLFTAEHLNTLGRAGDLEQVKAAVADLGKALAR